MALGSGGEKVSEDELSVRATKNFDYVLAALTSNALYKIALKVVIAFRTVIRRIQLPLKVEKTFLLSSIPVPYMHPFPHLYA